jgi:preprotein translocase subunit SecA
MGVPIFGPLMKKLFGTRNQRMVKRYLRVVDAVNALEPSVRALTDAELRAKTDEFRRRIKDGEKPVDLIPEIFAVAREAMDRSVGIRNVLDPELKFDASRLPEPVQAIHRELMAKAAAMPPADPTGEFRGCREPVPAWRSIDIPNGLYEAVREILPQSKPPFRARPFDVQIIGGVVLSEGRIAEMRTGEGKTIVGPLACYLACLEHKQVHVVTVNDYLVQRDRDWTFPFFHALGLTVGSIHPMHMQGPQEKQVAYSCDVVYGTTAEFGFDYLRDNMKLRVEDQLQKGRHDFAIVDEVDSILIDEARTPLIISGPAHAGQPRYDLADRLARHLVGRQSEWNTADGKVQKCKAEIAGLEGDIRNARDKAKVPELKARMDAARTRLPQLESERDRHVQFYEVELDKKRATPTHEGITEAQKVAGVGSFYVGDNVDLPHLLEQSLRAHVVYQRDRDYVVAPDENGVEGVVIVDQNTGRKMVGRQWSDGLHQAVEAKEGVRIKEETQTMATITIQNYFKLYGRLAGMTGTADTEATEFHEIYRLDVVAIPTNVPVVRQDRNDLVFLAIKDKWDAIVDEIKHHHDVGRPVLVGTTSVEKSEFLSQLLKSRHQIPHEVLNAKQHEREAEIVLGAGRLGAVMIATNMAGRGTDIKLQPFTRAELLDHWKRRNLAPREAKPEWTDEEIVASSWRHMAIRELGKEAVEGKDDAAARLGLLRKWCVERQVPEKTAAKMSEEDCLEELDAAGAPPKHRLALWEGVEAMGGLHIVGTERHESRRIDNQLRGRAGRQGDHGSSRFFLSLEDDLMKMFAGKATLKALSALGMKEGDALDSPMLTRQIEKAQRKVEERNFQMRKNILEYDEPMEHQRRAFYGQRQPILEGKGIRESVLEYLDEACDEAAGRFLGRDFVPECIAEWTRETCGIALEPERFRGKDLEQVQKMVLTDCLEESASQVRVTVAEYFPDDVEPSERDGEGFARWARAAVDAEFDPAEMATVDADEAIARLDRAAERKYRSIDLDPLAAFLDKGFAPQRLAEWVARTLGVPVDPGLFAGLPTGPEAPAEASKRLRSAIRAAYEERELAYPIDFAIEVTSANLAQDPAAAIEQFCRWTRARFGLDWTPETLPSREPAELKRLLMAEAKAMTPERIRGRAAGIVAGRDAAAIEEWLAGEAGLRLSADERAALATDPAGTVAGKLAEQMRSELATFERWILLQFLDTAWKDHLHSMDQIRDSIGFRAFSQKDPRIEFKKESARLFEQLHGQVRDRVVEVALKGRLNVPRPRPPQPAPAPAAAPARPAAPPAPAAHSVAAAAAVQGGAAVATVGRNEPCPCGSGKKYKQCHGLQRS